MAANTRGRSAGGELQDGFLGHRLEETFSLSQQTRAQPVAPSQIDLGPKARVSPELGPRTRGSIGLRGSPDIVIAPPAERLASGRVHPGEHASEARVISLAAHLQVFENEKRLVTRFPAAQRGRNPGSGGGERRETVGFRREIVELGALVDLCEVLAPAALENEASMDATAPGRVRPLDAERARDFRNGSLERGEKPGGDQARLRVARARFTAARTREGAVPPTCERLATEPSSVSTRYTSFPAFAEKRRSAASGNSSSAHPDCSAKRTARAAASWASRNARPFFTR